VALLRTATKHQGWSPSRPTRTSSTNTQRTQNRKAAELTGNRAGDGPSDCCNAAL